MSYPAPALPAARGSRSLRRTVVAALALATLLLAAAGATAQEPVLALDGPVLELLESDGFPAGLSLAAGPESWVLAWSENPGDPGSCCPRGIFAQRFDLQGRAVTEILRVDEPTTSFDERVLPSVAAGIDGSFLVAWHDLLDREVHARAYGAGNVPRAARIVNTYRQHWQIYPQASADPSGGYVVGWVTANVGDDGVRWPYVAHGQRLNRRGELVGEQFRLNGRVDAYDREISLVAGPRGLLATWITFAGNGPEMWARPLHADGRPAAPAVQVTPSGPYGWDLPTCALADGGYLVAWPTGIRRVGSDGELGPVQQPFAADAVYPWTLACGRFGEVLAVYQTEAEEVAVQRLAADGSALGEPRVVSDDDGLLVGDLSVAVGPGGRALVAWTAHPPFEPGQEERQHIRARFLRLAPEECVGTQGDLCLEDERFRVRVAWSNPYGEGAGVAAPRPLTDDSGAFWFFRETNLELVLKVLDGRPVNGHHWVFANALSTVEHWIEVSDTQTRASRLYHSPAGVRSGHVDTAAFGPAAGAPAASARPPAASSARVATAIDLLTKAGCVPSDTVLCLGGGRFSVEVAWSGEGAAQEARARPLTPDTGAFWFFDDDNLELLVKILDGGPVNGHFWVAWAGLTTVPHTLIVTDHGSGLIRRYPHPGGELGGGLETEAFPPPGAAGF